MKKVIIAVSLLALGACAKNAPPPEIITIPVQLVNIENTQVMVVGEKPSTKKLVSIRSTDRADQAMAVVLDYTKELKTYAADVTAQLEISEEENVEMRAKLKKIKQYILLQQASK